MSIERNVNLTCRICMRDSNNMKSIFTFENFSEKLLQIKEVITTCASVQIQICDGLPEQICWKCLGKLHDAFTFKETCETSDYQLRSTFIKCEVITASDDEEANVLNFSHYDEIIIKKELDLECAKIKSQRDTNTDDVKNRIENIPLLPNINDVNNRCENIPLLLETRDNHRLKSEESLTKENDISNGDSCIKKRKPTCIICNKQVRYNHDLEVHMRIHTGEKPYQCDVCEAEFGTVGNLRIHKNIHVASKPYKCDVCQRDFTHSNSLKRHVLRHTGERPYKCHVCQKGFAHSHNLKTHVLRHNGDRAFECDVCKKRFYTNGLLNEHKKSHTGIKPHKCDECDKHYMTRRTLLKHKAKQHIENSEFPSCKSK